MVSFDEMGVVALGSNLQGEFRSSLALLESAVARLPMAGFRVVQTSPWWQSQAWPDPRDPEYLNGVCLVETSLRPHEALAALLNLEESFGRERRFANSPRTLDLDLIALGRLIINQPDLRLPHPRAHLRAFVMGPLAQIAPGWRHPESGKTALTLSTEVSVGLGAKPIALP
jgi:2-amino-4-hydroxy-6-hydroxymethyldihydropteridine diphosphokinase